MDDGRMVLKAVKMMYSNRKEGDLLMDASETNSWEELRAMAAADKGKVWRQLVRQIKDMVHIQATKGKEKNKSKKRKGEEKAQDKKKKTKTDESGAVAKAARTAEAKSDEEEDSSEDEGWTIKRIPHKKVQSPVRNS